MNQRVMLYAGALIALLFLVGALFYLWIVQSPREVPPPIESALDKAVVETPAVAPSANPLNQVTPTANPIEKTNPFTNEYTNPFE